jgi:hypothetical protein
VKERDRIMRRAEDNDGNYQLQPASSLLSFLLRWQLG